MSPVLLSARRAAQVFCCIENVTIYFEAISPSRPRSALRSQLHCDDSWLQAYRHVLIALQNMRATDVMTSHAHISLVCGLCGESSSGPLSAHAAEPAARSAAPNISKGRGLGLVDSGLSSSLEQEETDMFHFHNVFSSCEKASLSKTMKLKMYRNELALVQRAAVTWQNMTSVQADCEVSAPKSFRILAEWPPALRQLEA